MLFSVQKYRVDETVNPKGEMQLLVIILAARFSIPIHMMRFIPASAQHNSSVLVSMVTEFGSCTSKPDTNMERSLPSTLLHSIFG